MFFSIISGLACGGMFVSILGLINPLWVGADDREIIYKSLEGWFIILLFTLFFYDADNFSIVLWFLSFVIMVIIDFIVKIKMDD